MLYKRVRARAKGYHPSYIWIHAPGSRRYWPFPSDTSRNADDYRRRGTPRLGSEIPQEDS